MEPLLQRKRDAIAHMFSTIAPRYDLLNRVLSGWQDVRWRRYAVQWLPSPSRLIVDIGTGTGDFAFAALRRYPEAKVVGIDLSAPMLRLARQKAQKLGFGRQVEWLRADGLQLPLRDGVADAVLCAFVIRNFEDLSAGLREIARVLRPGGAALLLEFCQPPLKWWRTPIGLFVRYGVPLLGRLLSDPTAYAYLAASIDNFQPAAQIAEALRQQGFRQVQWQTLTFGVTTFFRAVR